MQLLSATNHQMAYVLCCTSANEALFSWVLNHIEKYCCQPFLDNMLLRFEDYTEMTNYNKPPENIATKKKWTIE